MRGNRRSSRVLVVGLLGLSLALVGCDRKFPVVQWPGAFSSQTVRQLEGNASRSVAVSTAIRAKSNSKSNSKSPLTCASTRGKPNFLVFGGGGAPSYNEIAIEKNVLYFQRTLKTLGFATSQPQIYFANGNDGAKTVRLIDPKTDEETFKAPEIPGLLGPATRDNLRSALTQATLRQTPPAKMPTANPPSAKTPSAQPPTPQPLFFYFTGHGSRNPKNVNNNAMILWDEDEVSVQDFASQLDRLPQATPIVTVMVQCYSGAFANMIYEKGDPQRPVALQTRCGFFATIKQLPSVGCTPSVDEADYEDYSSSFFAGLSGVNRVGQPVASADYDRDGRVAFREAHAFAKVDEQASDLPISTSEAWLRDGLSDAAVETTMNAAVADVLATARPEQQYVVATIAEEFGFDRARSFEANVAALPLTKKLDEVSNTKLTRLQLELINIAAEKAIRESGDKAVLAVLDRLLQCEDGSWK
jgi:hypothetical protein